MIRFRVFALGGPLCRLVLSMSRDDPSSRRMSLVAEVIKDLASTFSDERTKLERQWDQGDKVSTEDLRLVLRRYRSFFDRFLSI